MLRYVEVGGIEIDYKSAQAFAEELGKRKQQRSDVLLEIALRDAKAFIAGKMVLFWGGMRVGDQSIFFLRKS